MNHITVTQQRKPEENRVSEKENRRLAELHKVFSAKDGETRKVQLLHPFSVTSRASLSASTLREAGYPVGIIEAPGEGPTSPFLLLSQTDIFCRIKYLYRSLTLTS